jgi:hypothetical protein
MGDYAGVPTAGLLFGTHDTKHSRLLLKGFDKTNAPDEVNVVGLATTDPDFNGHGLAHIQRGERRRPVQRERRALLL